jgi:hypothetical protein
MRLFHKRGSMSELWTHWFRKHGHQELFWAVAGSILGGVAAVGTANKGEHLFAFFAALGGSIPAIRVLWPVLRNYLSYPSPTGDSKKSGRQLPEISIPHVTVFADGGGCTFDVEAVVAQDPEFVRRVKFATSTEIIEDITRLNLYGYHDSKYGRWKDESFRIQKLERNSALAAKNPYTFATLLDAQNPDVYLGFTSILPVSADGLRRYLTPPGVPDNLVKADMITTPRTQFSAVLFFAISHIKMYRRRHPIAEFDNKGELFLKYPDHAVLSDLMKMVMYQLAMLVASSDQQDEFPVIGQSSVESVQKLFMRVGMDEADDVITADREPGYRGLVQPENVGAARGLLGFAGSGQITGS